MSKSTFGRRVSDVTLTASPTQECSQGMLWLTPTRLGNIRKRKDSWQSKRHRESERVQDTHICFVTIRGV